LIDIAETLQSIQRDILDWLRFEHAVIANLLMGITWAIDWPARRSLVPDLVGRDLVLSAIALDNITMNLTRIFGPLMSGAITAYVGAAIVAVPVLVSLCRSIVAARISWTDLALFAVILLCITTALAILLYDETIFAPILQLYETAVLNKPLSGSAQGRFYWNLKSLQSLADTAGLGVGLGSSRSSSWAISVVSQLGLIGTLMMSALVLELARGFGQIQPARINFNVVAVHDSVRASALAGLVAAAVSGGNADPGILFFISLATVWACREYMASYRDVPLSARLKGSLREQHG
jgi:hypothetical protein